ncbi:hypothetical protein [Fischerella sp. PCC 9605]|uniref:hypothetical protein n=1 Tax=Fischerella sp. PCC 9605 TaxID=1173024 RepID=UPI0004AF31AD|nr:hypothetical protein [Fischerella sp. PCC 9605]
MFKERTSGQDSRRNQNQPFQFFCRRLSLIVKQLLPFLQAIAALFVIAKSLGFL